MENAVDVAIVVVCNVTFASFPRAAWLARKAVAGELSVGKFNKTLSPGSATKDRCPFSASHSPKAIY
jgi:hypothetical protein